MSKNKNMEGLKGSKIKLRGAELAYQLFINIVIAIVIVICVVPLMYVLGMSMTSQGEMIQKNYFVIIPENPTFSAYKQVLVPGVFRALGLTIIRAVLGVVAALALALPSGYVLAKVDLPGRKAFMIYLIITMVIGGGLIPSYLLMSKLHLINKFWVYIVPAFANTYGILVIKLFVEGIPDDLIDSAELDGASEAQKLWYIAVPLLKPTLCALGLFAAVTHWNAWFDALLYVRDSKLWPVQLVIRNLLTQSTASDITKNLDLFEKATPEASKMASVVVGIIPILCVYPFLQKYFIAGMYTGAVKG